MPLSPAIAWTILALAGSAPQSPRDSSRAEANVHVSEQVVRVRLADRLVRVALQLKNDGAEGTFDFIVPQGLTPPRPVLRPLRAWEDGTKVDFDRTSDGILTRRMRFMPNQVKSFVAEFAVSLSDVPPDSGRMGIEIPLRFGPAWESAAVAVSRIVVDTRGLELKAPLSVSGKDWRRSTSFVTHQAKEQITESAVEIEWVRDGFYEIVTDGKRLADALLGDSRKYRGAPFREGNDVWIPVEIANLAIGGKLERHENHVVLVRNDQWYVVTHTRVLGGVRMVSLTDAVTKLGGHVSWRSGQYLVVFPSPSNFE